MQSLDMNVEDGAKDISSLAKSLENKSSALMATFDLINNHVAAKDEVLLLNFYANNHQRINQQLSSEDFNFKKLADAVKVKNSTNFNDIADSLNLLQVQISAVGNVSYDKFQPEVPSHHIQRHQDSYPSQHYQPRYLASNNNLMNRNSVAPELDRSTTHTGKATAGLNTRVSVLPTPQDPRKVDYNEFFHDLEGL